MNKTVSGGVTIGMGIAGRLALLSLVLITLPWLAYYYVQEMKTFLISGQEDAQQLATQAIATVLHDRHDLFDPEEDIPASIDDKTSFYAYPLDDEIQVDGYLGDWKELRERATHYGKESTISKHGDQLPDAINFSLVLGIRKNYLYGAIKVNDKHIIYRHPGYRRLDNSDHIRLTYIDHGGITRYLLMTTEGPGILSTYSMQPNWKYPLTGLPMRNVQAQWHTRADGYNVEFRIPMDLLGADKRIRISVADVTDSNSRQVESVVASLPTGRSSGFNKLIIRSTELERILSGLKRSDARIWIVDRYRRVRAVVGNEQIDHDLAQTDDEYNSGSGKVESLTDRLSETFVMDALAGTPGIKRIALKATDDEIILTAAPILSEKNVLGAVVLEQNTRDILVLHRQTFQRMAMWSLLVVFGIVAGILLFAYRLAWRVRRLSVETNLAIDHDGKILASTINAENASTDELGSLSNSITDILQRLEKYTGFLERIPRTLRHEINNPLNVISTSLQNLAENSPQLKDSRYIESAERGIARLSHIVDSLTEAASLEAALRNDEVNQVDLGELLSTYTESCNQTQPNSRFLFEGKCAGVLINGSSVRIEQLLDKLIENAIDFSSESSPVTIRLETGKDSAVIRVLNEGPELPENIRGSLFTSMFSERHRADNRPHLGVGLYVARTIADFHGAHMTAENRQDTKGACFSVTFPRVFAADS